MIVPVEQMQMLPVASGPEDGIQRGVELVGLLKALVALVAEIPAPIAPPTRLRRPKSADLVDEDATFIVIPAPPKPLVPPTAMPLAVAW